ncbi:hypothetical protein RvY_17511 [Ramazzottius varieornatus]|uniref:J domain-containing protein n=1 Tax=Ramazzottius varieornatus TaxID=947166 RepID=A0A1D1W2D2_RAMVA|nr:hypothetical protein RvY_17511 [Ramazzottius varieornatus]
MKCHYDILEVARDAKVDDIKKARDRLAKKFHPDKALQSGDASLVQEYTVTFRLIQQAYEVLSDAHERAWYDSHRDQILSSKTAVQEDIDIYAYFNSSAYSGFGDDPKGFFATYEKVFAKIGDVDRRKAEEAGEDYDVPIFGLSTSSYEDVVHPFYAFWQSYSTKRAFFHLDKWDLRTADNRRISRAMEKENKKVRDTAKKDWNESVRELVNFVRKRDPRVKAHRKILEERAEENRRKVVENQQEQLKKRQAMMTSHVVHHSAELEKQYRDLEKSLKKDGRGNETEESGEGEDEVDGEEEEEMEEEDDDDPLYCVGCDKRFKSFPAMRNHVQSKQHKKNMEMLRSELEEDIVHLDEALNNVDLNETGEEDSLEIAEEITERTPKTEERSSGKEDSVVDQEEQKGSKATKVRFETAPEVYTIPQPEEGDVLPAEAEPLVEVEEYVSRNKSKKEKKTKQTQKKVQELGTKCGVCRQAFPTRNKLFDHIKSTGHALLKEH